MISFDCNPFTSICNDAIEYWKDFLLSFYQDPLQFCCQHILQSHHKNLLHFYGKSVKRVHNYSSIHILAPLFSHFTHPVFKPAKGISINPVTKILFFIFLHVMREGGGKCKWQGHHLSPSAENMKGLSNPRELRPREDKAEYQSPQGYPS